MRGWILDLTPHDNNLILWLRTADTCVPFEVPYQPRFYLFAPGIHFEDYAASLASHPQVADVAPEFHRLQLRGPRRPVLAVTVSSSEQFGQVVRDVKARVIPRFSVFNGDLPVTQLWYLEQEHYPFEQVEVHTDATGRRVTRIDACDSRWAIDYALPAFRTVDLRLEADNMFHVQSSSGASLQTTEPLLLQDWIQAQDPDILFTEDGDTRVFPMLIDRARQTGVLHQLSLSRDQSPHLYPNQVLSPGRVVYRYGSPVFYHPHPHLLRGRLHLDRSNMTYDSFEGLVEACRITSFPPQRAARTSPGNGINMLQMQEALRRGVLIPETKTRPERYKTGMELLTADRGGHVITPRMGIFSEVGELDFTSMYPSLMVRYNISPEALFCDCCQEDARIVPELGYRLCRRELGIVPTFLKPILQKRITYKRRRHENPVYEARQAALKWLLVVCLDHDEIVPLSVDGELQLVRIGSFIDRYVIDLGVTPCNQNLQVVGLDEQFKTAFVPVRKLFKLKAPNTLLKVFLEEGREITLTPDHPSYVLDEGKLQVKETCQLKEGDFLPVMLTIPSGSKPYQFDFIEILLKQLAGEDLDIWRVRGSVLRNAISQHYESPASFLPQGSHTRQVLSQWRKAGHIPLRYFKLLKLPIDVHRHLQIGRGRRSGGLVQWIPATVALDEDLAFLLGFFVGDGSATQNMVRLDVNGEDFDVVNRIRRTISKLFDLKAHVRKEPHANMYVVQINSIALVELFEKAFLIGPSASRGRLRVPFYIFNAPKAVRHEFLAGLIASDGYVEESRNVVRIATKSKELLDQLGYLALTLDVDFALYRSKTSATHSLCITGTRSLNTILANSTLKEKHKQVLCHKNPRLLRDSRLRGIPVRETSLGQLARKHRTIRVPRIDASERAQRSVAQKQAAKLSAKPTLSQHDREQLAFINRLVEGDIGFAKIKRISHVKPSSEYVYCLEVDNQLSGFAAGGGGIFTHNCFGYLGFRAARFGRVEAHECVTAYSRRVLLKTKALCERKGFRVLHGIVDCVWLQKTGATAEEYIALCDAIREATKLPIDFEGRYRWIMFLPCRGQSYGALTRYCGAKEDGTIKVRGIELRRGDTPPLIKQFQLDLLTQMAGAEDADELRNLVPALLPQVMSLVERIRQGDVAPKDLAITQRISRTPENYAQQCSQAIAAELAISYGQELHPGQSVAYVHTDARARHPLSRVALPDTAAATHYDADKYVELLLRATDTLFAPLGWDYQKLFHYATPHARQRPLQLTLN
jgi:DNA polymerase elongation subunit (family B)